MSKGLEISLSYIPVINFALQQNHVPVIREIVLRNIGDEQVDDIDLAVSFEPEFALEYSQHLDSLAPGMSKRISVVPITLSTDYLASLTERIAGTINLTARSGDELLAEKHCNISILTFNEWSGSGVMPESLAAFSTPNHPGVAVINKRASEFLGRWTGNPSLDAYLSRDPNRVKYQMAAIYEAIAEKAITYCVAPASFESQGQRIRTVDEIMTLKMGNCLDMTMLYASCLEAAGLHPLVVLTDNHAFAGCWLIPDSFPDSINDDPALISKRMADGMNEILVVECTAMNEGSKASFDKACDAARHEIMNPERFSYFLDVCRARIGQIRPLPLRTVDDEGNYVVEDNDEPRANAAPTDMSATDLVIDAEAVVSKKTIWERKLLDLTLRNNLLNLRMTKGTIPFISANIGMLEDALANNEDFRVCPKPLDWDCELLSNGLYKSVNATDPIHEVIQQELRQNRIHAYLEEEPLRVSLTHLYRTAKISMEENGANTLYLALGLLRWYENPSSQKPRYAPILLVPVELVRRSASSGYMLRSRDEDTMLNITLLELLRQMFDITIGGLDPLPKDGSGIDISLVFNTIRVKIMEQKNWDVVEQAVLGNFSFNKFIMWNDIHTHSDILAESPIVSSLMSGVVDPTINVEINEADDLDKKFRAGDLLLPISADSSQIEAITAALSGKSFILHGPPGTGKSQTITNIIANALYRGKKVLFVAEKMAALEVVQNRLNSIGLGPFCLELHSNKAKKSSVLAQLKRTTEVAMTRSPEEYRVEAEHINSVRDEMNACVQALHKAYPLGLSLYDCISRYASIDETCPEFAMTASKAEVVTGDMVARMEIVLDELKAVLAIVGNPSENPLRGIGTTEYDGSVESALASLPEILSLIGSLEAKVKIFREKVFGLIGDISKEEYDFLMELSYPLSTEGIHAAILAEPESSLAAVEEAVDRGTLRDSLRKQLTAEYGEDIFEIDAKAYDAQWREIQSKMALVKFFASRSFLKKLASYCSKPIPAEQVLSFLKQLRAFQEADRFITDLKRGNLFIGNVINGYDTDWDKVRESCVMARNVRAAVGKRITGQQRVDALLGTLAGVLMADGCDRFGQILDEREMLRERLARVVDTLGARMSEPSGDVFAGARELVSRWYSGKDKIRSWVLYNRHLESVVDIGFSDIAQQIASGSYRPEVLKDAFHKALYKAYAEHILMHELQLQLFHGVLFEEKIARFRGLCKDFETLTREELFAKIASSLPALQREASRTSEVGILQRNIQNGCRGISLRNFFASIQDLLHRMCPCMLMSPMSVAQYIEAGGMKFDLVIFDEASQMPTCEAVGTIARGDSIIVVGDPKQLPPTTFFNANTFDEDNPHIEDLESILDDCLAFNLPSKYLRWHYRSKHESLIAFSNSKYYENRLHTFPSPDDLCTKIRYQHVEGVYDRGGSRQNRAEAEAIMKEIERRLSDPIMSKMSIGVVTFNTNQQSLLEDMLNDLFVKRPDLEKVAFECEEPIFIKNLENVQGDERDVILFSIGYGQDKAGRVTLNFGPLNRDGGWRRLNVAVSRARYEMKVFSTLRSEQIDLRRTQAEGVAGLKEFLEYAERGEALGSSEAGPGAPAAGSSDGLVEAVAKAIRERGYEVRTNIGSSGYKVDVAVVNPSDPDTYIFGVLCDGYNYASSRSARDREIVQVGVLRKLGWNICRLWAMDWWTDKEAVVEEICLKIEDAVAGRYVEVEEEPIRLYNSVFASGGASVEEVGAEVDKDVEPLSHEPESASGLVPYTFAELVSFPLSADGIASGFYDDIIKGYIAEVIEAEAPIKHDLLCKRVLRAIDIARMGPRVAARMQSIIDSMNLKKTEEIGPVYWKDTQDPQNYSLIRYSNEREAMHIPDMESKNAAVHVLTQQGAMPFESLIREMGKTFGYSRTGDNVYMAMMCGVELAAKLALIDMSDRERISVWKT